MNPEYAPATPPEPTPPRWRLRAGYAALALAALLPLGAAFVPYLPLSTAAKAVLAGALLAGAPEVLLLVAGVLLGKRTLAVLLGRAKAAVLGVFQKRPVSKGRYYAGLTLLLAGVLPLYLYGYAPARLPGGATRLATLIAADLSVLVALWLMGGEFWDLARRLFVWEERDASAAPPSRS